MELGARKLKILQAVIEAYIQTGEPVGSKALCELLDVSVSSATIRKEDVRVVAGRRQRDAARIVRGRVVVVEREDRCKGCGL